MKLALFLAPALILSMTDAFKADLAPKPKQMDSISTGLGAAISPMNTGPQTFGGRKIPSVAELKTKRDEVVLEPYYGVPNGILGAVPTLLALHSVCFSPDGFPTPFAWAGAAVHLFLGYYILKQTDRVRCVFDKRSFEFKNIKGNELVTKPNKNYVKGTINKWNCDTTVDFGYFPSKSYPLVVWFKETETPSNTWGRYGLWGQWLQNPSPTAPAIHFFPGFIDIKSWEKEMLARGAKHD